MNRRMLRIVLVAMIPAAWLAIQTCPTGLADEEAKANAEAAKSLIGTWQLRTAKNPGTPSGIGTRLKMYTGTHWCVVQPDPQSGRIVFQHGGHYSFDGSVLTETVDFAGESTAILIGRTSKFQLKITGDSLQQIDPDGRFNEIWERAKAPANK